MPSSLKKHSSGEVSQDSSQEILAPLTTTLQIEIGFSYLLVLVVLEAVMEVLVDQPARLATLMDLDVVEQAEAVVELKTASVAAEVVLTELELLLYLEVVSQVEEDRVDPLEVGMMDGMAVAVVAVTVAIVVVLDTVVEDRVMLILPYLMLITHFTLQQVLAPLHIGI